MIYKVLLRLDFFLWDYFMPKINTNFFKWKINSFLALVYISIYPLPRKFLINYFRGKEKLMVINSRELIVNNHLIINKFVNKIQSEILVNKVDGTLQVCQIDVDNPNYKYSVGSFIIDYQLDHGKVKVDIHSKYEFKDSPGRITNHLHKWLYALKTKGKAHDFGIKADSWQTDLQELNILKAEHTGKKSPKFKLLV